MTCERGRVIMLGQLAIVFLIGILGIWKSIPVGLVMKLDPFWICSATIMGATVGILIIFLLGTRVRKYLERWIKESSLIRKENRLIRLFNKYGIHGLGVLGTLVMGPNMTMAIGLTIANKPGVLMLWTLIGTVMWSIALTYVGFLGISIF